MNKNVNIPICQIVGYKNSGKTTLMEKLIRHFSSLGMRVGTMKHHGHGGEPAFAENTDSDRHRAAGSFISAVEGKKQLQLVLADASRLSLNEMIDLFLYFSIDLLLLEGYKQEHYPKIVLIRNEQDLHLLKDLSNIIAVGAMDVTNISDSFHTFSIMDMDAAIHKLAQLICC